MSLFWSVLGPETCFGEELLFHGLRYNIFIIIFIVFFRKYRKRRDTTLTEQKYYFEERVIIIRLKIFRIIVFYKFLW